MKPAALACVTLAAALAQACGSDSGEKKNLDPSADGGAGTGGFGGGGAEGGIDLDGTAPNPCDAPDAPENCKLVPSGPACGDAEINQGSEECDDGNSLPGDGCSGVCVVESYYDCPKPGEPCVSTIECGDGVIGPGEACDDGNATGGDGCSASCNLVEKGYLCPKPNQACIRVHLCGDGTLDSNEGCDDGDASPGDGCDAKCRVELGWKCDGSPSTCTATTCGDGNTEGAESCDDGNTTPFDGCSAVCRAEPDCSGSSCTSSCGDGIVLAEDCDDGNLRDGDGCSSSCTVEDGYDCTGAGACTMIGGKCVLQVPVVFRDFNASHSDFEPSANSTGQTGLVLATLDSEGKPVYSGAANGSIASVASFADWYRDAPPTNATIVDTLTLWDNAKGGFVNRWGPNGEQWQAYANLVWCGNGGTSCASCAAGSYDVCLDPCTPWGNSSECGGTAVLYDGDPVFFPLDGNPKALGDTRFSAKIAPEYGGNWDAEPGSPLHNFHFTTEVHYWFQYDSTATVQLDFTGDDDVWVFVNKKLALDLGGWHPPQSGSVTIDAASAAGYGLANGKVYQIAVFHAERKTEGSSFRLTLSGFDLAPSDCATDCGDGTLAPGEECDDGASSNTGDYGACSPDCTLGPRCGDGIEQDQEGEACDDGTNDGSYGGCAPDCQPGPHCGDGVVQPSHEQCDDAKNDGGYGECAPGCVLGAHCGDGHLNAPYEDCDDGNNDDQDGCSAACKKEVAVPR